MIHRGARILLLSLGVMFGQASTRAADVPQKCKPFLDTVDRCQRYDALAGRTGWQSEFRLSVGKSGAVKEASIHTPQLPDQLVARMLKYDTEDGISVIRFDATQFQQGLLKVGPEVSGEFAIEMRAKAVSTRLNDLSIVFDAVGGELAFQFGGYENTRNTLSVGADANGNATVVEGDASVKIQPGTWHRVRLEVRKSEFVGLVDGRVVARGKPTAAFDFSKKRRPLIYLYASSAAIAEYRVDRPTEAVVDVQKTWKEAFVNKTREQVMSDLSELTKLLNDPEYTTRQSAHDQLARAGTLAEQPLLAATKAGGLEGRERAKSLLAFIGVKVDDE